MAARLAGLLAKQRTLLRITEQDVIDPDAHARFGSELSCEELADFAIADEGNPETHPISPFPM
jgi:hypothetical protein